MSIEPTSETTSEMAAPIEGQLSDGASQDVQAQPAEFSAPIKGEPEFELPEKFRGKPEELVRSYQNLESEFGRTRQEAAEIKRQNQLLQQQLLQMQPPQPSEEELFSREWEQDPKMAVYNQTQRLAQRQQMAQTQLATNWFYEKAKSDSQNYPHFQKLEGRMAEIAQDLVTQGLVDRKVIATPQAIHHLYGLAERDHLREIVSQARVQGHREAETKRKEVAQAAFESPSPVSSTPEVSFQEMDVEQMEKTLPWHERR